VFASNDVPPLEAEPMEDGADSNASPQRLNGAVRELPMATTSVPSSPSPR
jgi:hypothetical protein